MTQPPLLSLNEVLASLQGLTYIQLYYLSHTITEIMPDEQVAMQCIRNRIASESQTDPVVANEAEGSQPSKNKPSMSLIVKSVLKLSQDELQTLGDAILKRMQQLPSPFPKRDPESRTWGISYGLGQVFPEENFKPQIETPTEPPAWFQQVRALSHQAIQMLHTNPEEANQIMNQAITLAEQNRFPTFALKIPWEGMTSRNELRLAELFQEAVEFYRTQNDPFELAQKLRDWAFLQARIENREKALEILNEAETILESLTPEVLATTHHNRVLLQNLITNEVLIRTKIVEIERLRKQILSGEEVRGGYTIQTI